MYVDPGNPRVHEREREREPLNPHTKSVCLVSLLTRKPKKPFHVRTVPTHVLAAADCVENVPEVECSAS